MPGSQDNPWTTLRSTLQYDNPWIQVAEHKVLTPTGAPGIYGTVHFKNLALAVLPIDADGHTYLVGQYRYPLRQYSWELPEGGGCHEVPPLESAQRELAEETGLRARGWQELMRLHLSNAVCDEAAVSYVAWDLIQGEAAPNETERLEIRRLHFSDALAMVWRGEITDALSVATIMRVELMRQRGDAPEPVAASLKMVR